MKLVLYSNPGNGVLEKIEKEIFPKNRKIVFGYMPADGDNPKSHYTPFWRELSKKHQAEFVYIDNSRKPSRKNINDFNKINSLAIMGGNVFSLLHNLRESGLDKFILEKAKENDFIYSGFSAGAMIITPNIRIAGQEHGWTFGYDENLVNIKDTKALGLVDFEILPHYNEKLDLKKLRNYMRKYNVTVKPLTDNDIIIID